MRCLYCVGFTDIYLRKYLSLFFRYYTQVGTSFGTMPRYLQMVWWLCQTLWLESLSSLRNPASNVSNQLQVPGRMHLLTTFIDHSRLDWNKNNSFYPKTFVFFFPSSFDFQIFHRCFLQKNGLIFSTTIDFFYSSSFKNKIKIIRSKKKKKRKRKTSYLSWLKAKENVWWKKSVVSV